MAVKAKNDQLAIDRLKNVQSTLLQSPLPLKIIGMAVSYTHLTLPTKRIV